MKCPHCGEDLGLNNICINPICSYFGTEINLPNDSNSEETKDSVQNTSNSRDNNINDSIKYNTNTDSPYIHSNYYDKNSSKIEYISATPNNISEKEYTSFIGRNSAYYLKFIANLKNKNKFSSWNWPCFFLNWYWLLYRKLYIPAIILIVINFVSSKLFERNSYLVIALIIRIALAIYANNIYLTNCTRKINIIKKTSFLNEDEYIQKLRKKGGVTLLWPIVALIIAIIVSIIYVMVLFSNMAKSPHFSGSYYL